MRWLISGLLAYTWALFHMVIFGEQMPFVIFLMFVVLMYAMLERVVVVRRKDQE